MGKLADIFKPAVSSGSAAASGGSGESGSSSKFGAALSAGKTRVGDFSTGVVRSPTNFNAAANINAGAKAGRLAFGPASSAKTGSSSAGKLNAGAANNQTNFGATTNLNSGAKAGSSVFGAASLAKAGGSAGKTRVGDFSTGVVRSPTNFNAAANINTGAKAGRSMPEKVSGKDWKADTETAPGGTGLLKPLEVSSPWDRPEGSLSRRAYDRGTKAGEDYENISDDRRKFILSYYDTLDRKEVTDAYLNLEKLIADKDYESDNFVKVYDFLTRYLSDEMELERKQNGVILNPQYQALEQVLSDVNTLWAQYAIDSTNHYSGMYSDQLDAGINAIFGGVINADDYDDKVAAGREAMEQDSKAQKWFDQHMANATDTQKNLIYCMYGTEGFAGVKELYNDYLGSALNYVNAGKDFVDNIYNNGVMAGDVSDTIKQSFASILGKGGVYWDEVKQVFTNTESDPNDKTLIGNYTVNDAIDYGLRTELGGIADSTEFQEIGSAGFTQMRADGVKGDWYTDARENASELQKQFLGYMYWATEGDSAAVEAVWDSFKEEGDAIWQVVNGSNTVVSGEGAIKAEMYKNYLGKNGESMPGWMTGGKDMTTAEWLWDVASTTANQVPQYVGNVVGMALGALANRIGIPVNPADVGRVLGSGAMSVGAYGGSYKETRDEGYSKKQSTAYAGWQAASEFVVEYLLSSKTPVGGLLADKWKSSIASRITVPLIRTIVDLGLDIGNESVQEAVQEAFDPISRNIILGEDNEFLSNSEDVVYNGLMGGVSAAIFNLIGGATGKGIDLAVSAKIELDNAKIGAALNAQQSTAKLVDTVLNAKIEPETQEQKDYLSKARNAAEKIQAGKGSDELVGELLRDASFAGVDTSFLTNPETASYTKDQITTADMRAAAVSRLATLGGDTSLAEDVAKLAKGEMVSEEVQGKIAKDPAAAQVLEELQGDLDMGQADNALTIAAHATTEKGGDEAKIAYAVQENNPDKVVLTPNQEYLASEGVKPADAQRIGAVFDKVMGGEEITRDEAKLVRIKSPVIQAALLTRLGIDLHESASTDMVMTELNEKAAEMAKIKDMQAGVDQSIKPIEDLMRRVANGTAAQTGTGVPSQVAGVQNVGGTAAGVQGAGADVGVPQGGTGSGGQVAAGGPGGVQTVHGVQASGAEPSVRRPRVISPDKLTNEQRGTQRRLAQDGAGSILFVEGADSSTSWNEELGAYQIAIRTDGPFTEEQYADHETGHLWLKALSTSDYDQFLQLVKNAFSGDYETAFNQMKSLYEAKGYLQDIPTEEIEKSLVEELYCFARGSQDFGKTKSKTYTFNFAQYHNAIMQIEKLAHLEAMAKGDMSDPWVAENVAKGNYDQQFYERQGYLDDMETQPAPRQQQKSPTKTIQEKRTEAKEKLDKLPTEAKTEKKGKEKKSPIPSKSEVEKLREHYEQRKAAQERKFKEGRLNKTQEQLDNKLARLDNEFVQKLGEMAVNTPVTPEAIARASNLSEEVRTDLLSELEGLDAELKADPSIAYNRGYLTRVNAWFEKAKAAMDEAETAAPKTTAVSEARAEYDNLLAQMSENPALAQDEEFAARMTEAAAKVMAEQEQALSERQEKLDKAEKRLAKEKPFDYDAELKKLTYEYKRKRDAQYKRMESNPNKTDESLNAKLKKYQDEYVYKVSRLRAEARRRGDTRFSADAGINEGEDNNEQVLHSGAPERRANAPGRRELQALGRGQAGTQNASSDDKGGNRSGVEIARRRCEAVGIRPGQFIQEADWTPQQREVAEQLYDAGFRGVTLFRRLPGMKTKWVGQSWFENGVPTAAVCVNAGIAAKKIARHESWHLWLRALKGDKAHGKHMDFVDFILRNTFTDPDEWNRIRQSYHEKKDSDFREIETEKGRGFGWNDNEIEQNINADIMEEIFCDLASGQIYEDERLYDVLDLIEASGVMALSQGDYEDPSARTLLRNGYANSEYAREQGYDMSRAMLASLRNFMMDRDSPLFSADADIEELMDRSDEMRSGESEAQVWQDRSLNTLSADTYSDKMDALLNEYETASPERQAEITKEMLALQGESFNDFVAPMEEEEKPKKKAKKPVIPPKAEAKKAEAQAKKAEPAKPIIPPKTEPAKAAAFDIPLSDVTGPFDVAGLTLGKAKDKVYQAMRLLQKKSSLTANEQAQLQNLRAQYDKLQNLIAEKGKTLTDPQAKFNLLIEGTRAETKTPEAKAKNVFKPKAEKTEAKKPAPAKSAPVNEEPAEVKRPSMKRGDEPVDVKGLPKKKAIAKVTDEKAKFESWYQKEKADLDAQLDAKKLSDEAYGKQWSKLVKDRNNAIGRYDAQLKKLEAMDEPVKEKATVVKPDDVEYTEKTGKWWGKIKNAAALDIRRLRSDRNTYDVRITDSNGNTVVYNEVSPSRLEIALTEKLGRKAIAKDRLAPAYEAAETSLGEWQSVDNKAPVEGKTPKPKAERQLDNFGRKISPKLAQYMDGSTVRDSDGRLQSVYRLGPANGVRNANPNAKYTVWSERAATMNLLRGLNGAAAYDQANKRGGAKIEEWLNDLAEHPNMTEPNKNAIRAKIAGMEKSLAEYVTHVTRLDPWRPGYVTPKREDVIGNHTLLEGYVDIKNPLVIDAKGKGMDYVNETARKFVDDPRNLAGEVDVDGNSLGDFDGIKFINVKVTDGDKSLGGGQLDRDTVYVTFRPNQGKSTYNTDPHADSDLMQYSADADTETGYAEGSLEDTILKIMRDKDYDHAVESLALYLSQFYQTGVMPNVEDPKHQNIFNRRVSPAEENYLKQRAKDLIDKYGRIEPGEKPVREVFIPKARADGNVRQTYRTAAESKNTPEWGVSNVLRDIITSDDAVYETITDKSSIAAADREMRSKGFDKMDAEWRAKADSDAAYRINKYDIAKAVRLYSEAFKAGDAETAMRIMAELAEVGTTSAQNVQALRLIKHMPKSYQLYYLKRVVNRLNQRYSKKIDAGKMTELTIDRDLAKAVINAQTQEELDAAMKALIEDIAKQVPVTFADKWNAWRYLSMLGNPKTHIRNFFGNAIFTPAKFAKDVVDAGLESVFIKDPSKRRSSLKGVLGRNTEYREFAKQDYEGVKEELQSGGKYNPENKIMQARPIFKSKVLEFLRKFNGDYLEKEDGWFLRFHYVNALTNFLATQGMSVKELQDSPQGRKILNAARLYAFNEAQKATYRDASQLAAALNQLKRNSGAAGFLLEGELPFTKTPINIFKRGIEYSPIGLLKTLSYNATQLKKGDITANDFIDNLASGLTGTGIMALGMFLAKMGWLRGGGDDDDKQDEFDKLQGYQNYSINIGDHNYTIDWAAPSALPLFVGCEVFNQLQKKGELSTADWYNAMLTIAEPFTQLSMLSGLSSTLESLKYDENPVSSMALSMGSSYFTQAIPTLLAQIARSIPADRRTTFVDKNSNTPQVLQRWWQNNVLGKIPLANSERPEYIDAWGRKDTTSSFALRLLENAISPGYMNRIKTTPVDEELQRLADKVGTGVLMSAPERSIEINNQNHHLTAKQYATYAKTRGDAAMTMLADLFNSESYQDEMSDSEKAYAVNQIKQYANVLGKQAIFPDYEPTTDNWAEKCDGDPTRITNMALLKARANADGVTAGNNSNFYGLIISSNWMTTTDQAYAIAQQYSLGSTEYVYETKSSPKYAINSEHKEILAEHFRRIFPAYYEELVSTSQWRNADQKKRVELLSDARAAANADNKAWLARILAKQNAPLYVKK